MVFVILNAAIAVNMFVYAYRAADATIRQQSNPLVNAMYLMGVLASVFALEIFVSAFAPAALILFLGRLTLLLAGALSVHTCIYCIRFPELSRSAVALGFEIALDALALYVCFIQVRTFTVSDYMGVDFTSSSLFTGRMGVYFPWTWNHFYFAVFFGALPLFAVLTALVRAENLQKRIDVHKILMNCSGFFVALCAAFAIKVASARVPMFEALLLAPLFLLHVVLYKSAEKNALLDRRGMVSLAVQTAVLLLLPAVISGVIFVRLLPVFSANPLRFLMWAAAACVLLIVVAYQLEKLLVQTKFFRPPEYATLFEEELASIDFSKETGAITKEIEGIFRRNLTASAIDIVIDNGQSELETAYSSTGRQLFISSGTPAFDTLLNDKQTIVFRNELVSAYAFAKVRDSLLAIMDKAESDAMILLNEGSRIIGIIFLGPKISGNLYSSYDKATLTKLYSYFFVVGYYIRNIANESVLGTVNKEVFMSAQIISSIQKNIDPIRNAKIDSGYLMEAAHNIGGEFVDFIKLGEDRHIFVLGDMSGKGISASMSMVILKSIVRTYLSETKDFKLLVQRVNEFIRFNLPKGTFFAGVLGLINFSDNTMFYINCGVPALFMYTQAYNNVIEIQGEGRVLGFVRDITPYLKVKKINLNPGDIIVSCTDGMIDAHSLRGEIFGKARVQQAMMENASYSAQKMAQFIYDSLLQFTQKELEDDVSIMVLKCQALKAK